MPMYLVLIIVLLVLALGGVPNWGYPHGYGWYPSSIIVVIVVVVIVLALLGRL
jgi:Protein of unknown function (DUF3309)